MTSFIVRLMTSANINRF